MPCVTNFLMGFQPPTLCFSFVELDEGSYMREVLDDDWPVHAKRHVQSSRIRKIPNETRAQELPQPPSTLNKGV